MIRLFITLLLCLVTAVSVGAGEPYCIIRNYDERDGLSQRLVKQVVQDDNGMMWVATWNGLNRFDGHEFRCIRPGIDDDVRRYSSRLSDIKLGTDGYLWCRIDGRVVRFDTDSYTWHDTHSQLEQKFGRRLTAKAIAMTRDDELVITLDDDTYIIMPPGAEPESLASAAGDLGKRRYKSNGNRKVALPEHMSAQKPVIARRDDAGTVWVVTREGEVMCAPGADGPYTVMGHLDVANMSLRYTATDRQGNIWLCSKAGLHRLTIGTSPYTILRHGMPSMLRTSMTDSDGRVWLSWSDANCVCVTDTAFTAMNYLRRDGSLSRTPASFGSSVYSITETRPGEIWLGTKPDGLYRLTARDNEAGSGYRVQHFTHNPHDDTSPSGNAYYSSAVDSRGRLWLASMGTGIDVVESPSAPEPHFRNITASGGYPAEAMSVRMIRIIGDSMAVAATTGGLLSFNLPASLSDDTMRFMLHVSEPGRATSLGNIATMGVAVAPDGSLYVATESAGVARLMSPLSVLSATPWDFRSYHPQGGLNPDVALSVHSLGSDSLLLVTSSNEVYTLDPRTGSTKVYGRSFWHRDMRFSDAVPMRIGNNGWLLGLTDGAVRVDLDAGDATTDTFAIAFTSVSIAGRPDSLLTGHADRITLRPSERDVTLRFAALCYADDGALCYSFRVGDEEWTPLGTSRTVSFAGLAPGEYNVTVRSTDTHGQWIDNERTITIDVLPTFWETGLAKALYLLIAIALAGAVIWIVLYIRRIKRQQREMLETHLRMLEARAISNDTHDVEPEATAPSDMHPAKVETPRLSDDDRRLMDAVMDYIETHLSDPSVTVDDMSLALAVSRSGLTRKMKSLMGVTPAEFLRETRLTRATTLLGTTSKPIKEIAHTCGFSDMNYFGKCFKASRGVTPGAYRKSVAPSE